jgi:hypothetical protein
LLKSLSNTCIFVFLQTKTQNKLKRFSYIATVIIVLLFSDRATAEISNTEPNNRETIDPETTVTEEQEVTTPFFSFNFHMNNQLVQKSQDSTNVHSLSKFNFVFYFIYKLKYNDEPTSGEYFESPF